MTLVISENSPIGLIEDLFLISGAGFVFDGDRGQLVDESLSEPSEAN